MKFKTPGFNLILQICRNIKLGYQSWRSQTILYSFRKNTKYQETTAQCQQSSDREKVGPNCVIPSHNSSKECQPYLSIFCLLYQSIAAQKLQHICEIFLEAISSVGKCINVGEIVCVAACSQHSNATQNIGPGPLCHSEGHF